MLLDREEKERRLASSRNLLNILPPVNRAEVVSPERNGRGKSVPTSLKIVAGVLAKTEPVAEVADALGVSPVVVKRSKNSTNAEVRSAVEQTTERLRDMALEKLMLSLGVIDEEKTLNLSAKDASLVARNLAGVVDKLSPRNQEGGQGLSLVIYAPRQRKEDQYEVIEVKAG